MSAFLYQSLYFDLFPLPHNMADDDGRQELQTSYTLCTACRAETLLSLQIITLGWPNDNFLKLFIKHFFGASISSDYNIKISIKQSIS